MAWLGQLLAFFANARKVVDLINGLFAFGKTVWMKLKNKWAKEAVDKTTQTGDQRAEEEALGGTGGVPHIDPTGGLQERPVKDRS